MILYLRRLVNKVQSKQMKEALKLCLNLIMDRTNQIRLKFKMIRAKQKERREKRLNRRS